MKKNLARILCGLLLISTLSGCTNANETPENNSSSEISLEQNSSDRNSIDQSSLEQNEISEISQTAAPEQQHRSMETDVTASVFTELALKLFQKCGDNENSTLISPLSISEALAMSSIGAKDNTLKQFEALFGTDSASLCAYLSNYHNSLPYSKRNKMLVANSVWIKDDAAFRVNEEFLKKTSEDFSALVKKAAFDSNTLDDINHWVSENTIGLIPQILDQIPAEAILYLINAVAFDAEWETTYNISDIRDSYFTDINHQKHKVEMMFSDESQYLQDDKAQGFIKYYADRKYAFAALLPNENLSLQDYVANLTGEKLNSLLNNPANEAVRAGIPKFKTGSGLNLNSVLKTLGISDAFDSKLADFSDMGTYPGGNIYINSILHKTFLTLDEKGTKAGAATVVEFGVDCVSIDKKEPIRITLDRPFFYMIIDCEEKLPIFMGTAYDIEN